MSNLPSFPASFKILDKDGTNLLKVDANLAARMSARPIDVGALSSYSLDRNTGTITAGQAGGGDGFQFRWGDSTPLALIRGVSLSFASYDVRFAAGIAQFEMVAARGYTASGSGGQNLTPTGDNQKMRTSFGTSLATDVRLASTTHLTAGTHALDTNAMGSRICAVGTTTYTFWQPTGCIFYRDLGSAEWPLVLAQNEGFIIPAYVPATGT